MTTAIADRARAVRIDKSQGGVLRLVPILGPSHEQPAYKLLQNETLNAITVTEVSESGSVPELKVQNTLDVMVFLMDGQELVGAKQNRILNTDVLVPAGSTVNIPVSCVEHGRWHHVSRTFVPGKAASHRTRAGKSPRVHAALRSGGQHDANQSAVWDEVRACLAQSGSSSHTEALADAYARREQDLVKFRGELNLPGDAVGVAAFHGSRFQGLDLFDRHTTLRYFWESLVDSYAIDFLGTPVNPAAPAESVDAAIIQQMLERAAGGNWESFRSPGIGMDYRLEDPQANGSALVWEDQVVVHLQIFPKATEGQETPVRRPRIHRPYGQ